MSNGPGAIQTASLAHSASNAQQWAFYARSGMLLTPSKQARTTDVQVGGLTTHNFSPIPLDYDYDSDYADSDDYYYEYEHMQEVWL